MPGRNGSLVLLATFGSALTMGAMRVVRLLGFLAATLLAALVAVITDFASREDGHNCPYEVSSHGA